MGQKPTSFSRDIEQSQAIIFSKFDIKFEAWL